MPLTKWSDIRDEHIDRIGQENFEAGKEQMLAEARGWRLAEIRRHRGLTQAQAASRMGVGKSQISQIERGNVSPDAKEDRSCNDCLSRFRSLLTCVFAGQHSARAAVPSKQPAAGSSPARRAHQKRQVKPRLMAPCG
jgi:DNA-binding XRE family transcriptional regulator